MTCAIEMDGWMDGWMDYTGQGKAQKVQRQRPVSNRAKRSAHALVETVRLRLDTLSGLCRK
jgi:hypothetical protein